MSYVMAGAGTALAGIGHGRGTASTTVVGVVDGFAAAVGVTLCEEDAAGCAALLMSHVMTACKSVLLGIGQ